MRREARMEQRPNNTQLACYFRQPFPAGGDRAASGLRARVAILQNEYYSEKRTHDIVCYTTRDVNKSYYTRNLHCTLCARVCILHSWSIRILYVYITYYHIHIITVTQKVVAYPPPSAHHFTATIHIRPNTPRVRLA